jgi:hypothetical protein
MPVRQAFLLRSVMWIGRYLFEPPKNQHPMLSFTSWLLAGLLSFSISTNPVSLEKAVDASVLSADTPDHNSPLQD